jgi:nitronate monooxygenase/enoyl-[acyl-carrier protein] reductase II
VDAGAVVPQFLAEVHKNGGHELLPFTGQSAGLIHDIAPAAELVPRLMAEAKAALEAVESVLR